MQPHYNIVFECIGAVQGFRRLRLLEIVLPIYLPIPYRPRVLGSQVQEQAAAVLGNIRGHAKVLKVIYIGGPYRVMEVRDIDLIQTTTIP